MTKIEATTIAIVIALMILLHSTMLTAQAKSSISPYQSGYDHGCEDAKITNMPLRYINQPERGREFHTHEFNNGYDAGFSACGGNDIISTTPVDQAQAQSRRSNSASSSANANNNNNIIINNNIQIGKHHHK
jgi:hypothetical protein